MCNLSTNTVAVFFDFENIAIPLWRRNDEGPDFGALLKKISEYGRIVSARAYANWSNHVKLVTPLQSAGFDPVYVPTFTNGANGSHFSKNAADMYIAIDATDFVHTHPHINTFVLITGDKDFIPLAQILRRHGKKVIALGIKKSTSSFLQEVVDEWIYYRQIFTRVIESPKPENLSAEDNALVEAIKEIEGKDKTATLSSLKSKMIGVLGEFDEKQLTDRNGKPFSQFKEFVQDAARRGLVTMQKNGDSYDVFLN